MTEIILSSNERQALREFLRYLQTALPAHLVRVALFGSKARNSSRPESDLDVLVILDRDDRALRREILAEASHLSMQYDLLLSPRVIGRQRWERLRDFSLYRNVTRDALDLAQFL